MNCGFKTLLTLNICYSEVWGVRWSQGNNLSKQPWPGCHLPPLPASLLYWSLIQDSLFCSNYLIILHRAKEATAGDTSFIMTGAGFFFHLFTIKFRNPFHNWAWDLSSSSDWQTRVQSLSEAHLWLLSRKNSGNAFKQIKLSPHVRRLSVTLTLL